MRKIDALMEKLLRLMLKIVELEAEDRGIQTEEEVDGDLQP